MGRGCKRRGDEAGLIAVTRILHFVNHMGRKMEVVGSCYTVREKDVWRLAEVGPYKKRQLGVWAWLAVRLHEKKHRWAAGSWSERGRLGGSAIIQMNGWEFTIPLMTAVDD